MRNSGIFLSSLQEVRAAVTGKYAEDHNSRTYSESITYVCCYARAAGNKDELIAYTPSLQRMGSTQWPIATEKCESTYVLSTHLKRTMEINYLLLFF